MSKDLNNYNVRNILVLKEKLSNFLDFYRNDALLKNCPFKFKPYLSGPYYIFTLDNVTDAESSIIDSHQDEWM